MYLAWCLWTFALIGHLADSFSHLRGGGALLAAPKPHTLETTAVVSTIKANVAKLLPLKLTFFKAVRVCFQNEKLPPPQWSLFTEEQLFVGSPTSPRTLLAWRQMMSMSNLRYILWLSRHSWVLSQL